MVEYSWKIERKNVLKNIKYGNEGEYTYIREYNSCNLIKISKYHYVNTTYSNKTSKYTVIHYQRSERLLKNHHKNFQVWI